MQISKDKIQEFKVLWKNRFGEDKSDDFVYNQITKLATMIKLIYKPIRKVELAYYQ